jgi:predicted PurR-regulated permease PerM
MNQVISWLQNVLVRVVLTLSLVGVAFLASAALGYGNSFQAQADPLTPEATQYQVASDSSPFQAEQDRGKENFQNSANELFKQNKQPQAPSETTKEIGETLTKPAKNTKGTLEGVADVVPGR